MSKKSKCLHGYFLTMTNLASSGMSRHYECPSATLHFASDAEAHIGTNSCATRVPSSVQMAAGQYSSQSNLIGIFAPSSPAHLGDCMHRDPLLLSSHARDLVKLPTHPRRIFLMTITNSCAAEREMPRTSK